MRKALIALVAGIASFSAYGIGWLINPALGPVFVAPYYFVCQFYLSRGHPRAYLRDWRIMLALNASVLLLTVQSDRSTLMTQTLPWLISALAGTYAGAVVASAATRQGWRWVRVPRRTVIIAGVTWISGFAGFVVCSMVAHALEPPCRGLCWFGAGGAFGGFALGAAIGAYLADHRRGRFAVVLGAATALSAVGWTVTILVSARRATARLELPVFLATMLVELLLVTRLQAAAAASPEAAGTR